MQNMLGIKCGISRAFAEVYTFPLGWYPRNEILRTAGCLDERADDIKNVRQDLGIEETEIIGLVYWRWSAQDEPDYVWERED